MQTILFCASLKFFENRFKRDYIQIIRYLIPLLLRFTYSNKNNLLDKLYFNENHNLSYNKLVKSVNTEIIIYLFDFLNCYKLRKINYERLVHHMITLLLLFVNKFNCKPSILSDFIGGFHSINILNIHSTSDIIIRLSKILSQKSENRILSILLGTTGILAWISIRQIIFFKYIIKCKNIAKSISSSDKTWKSKINIPATIILLKGLYLLNLFYTIQICKFFSKALQPDFFIKKDNTDEIEQSREQIGNSIMKTVNIMKITVKDFRKLIKTKD